MKTKILAGMALLLGTMAACDDTTETIGNSLTDNMDHLTIATDTFNVATRSIVADSVLSRSTTGYLGRIKDPETGGYLTGDFMVQFHTLEGQTMPPVDSIVSRNAAGEIVADSCDIILYYETSYGDSIAPIKVTAFEMAKPMEEDVAYYSNFDPLAEGYVREGGIRENKMFTLADQSKSDSLRATTSYLPGIRIPLNKAYTDRSGKTYNNYGTYLMMKYFEDADNYKNSYNFIHDVCPGFYIKTQEGLGAMANISISQLNLYFRYSYDGTEYPSIISFAGTEEVLQTTTFTNDQTVISRLAADNSCTYLKTPAGIFTEMTLPVDEIVLNHENDTLNTAKVALTRINNDVHSEYSFDTPQTLLMVERDSMYTFFEKRKIADNRQSFLATDGSYTFYNIANLVRYMADSKAKGLQSDPNWLQKHPNWNKVVIIPVVDEYVVTSSNYYTGTQTKTLSKVTHDMSLQSTRLVGGSQNPYDAISISVIYSKFAGK